MMRCVITKNLAAKMESCIKQTHIEVTKQYSLGTCLEINGGVACFSGFDSYLSQVVGWGFTTRFKRFQAEIECIERFYKSLNHPRVDIELCPFVGNELSVFLNQRGYRMSELNQVSLLDLNTYQSVDCAPDRFSIRELNASAMHEWAKGVAVGFDAPEAKDQFFRYAQSRGVRIFAAYDDDLMVAGASVAVHDDFCDLGVTSTLPAYRGQGLQKKLLHARLQGAQREGVSWATVTTKPGTVSDCNVQKLGFHCAYTRIKMTLSPFPKNA